MVNYKPISDKSSLGVTSKDKLPIPPALKRPMDDKKKTDYPAAARKRKGL